MFSNLFSDKFKEVINAALKDAVYHKLEYDCHTNITDEDMLKLQFDFALENNDKKTFKRLTKQLNEVANHG